jgi:hypothetical protein
MHVYHHVTHSCATARQHDAVHAAGIVATAAAVVATPIPQGWQQLQHAIPMLALVSTHLQTLGPCSNACTSSLLHLACPSLNACNSIKKNAWDASAGKD